MKYKLKSPKEGIPTAKEFCNGKEFKCRIKNCPDDGYGFRCILIEKKKLIIFLCEKHYFKIPSCPDVIPLINIEE